MSPTSRSLAVLRSAGYTVAVVERWNAFARVRQDLFGFADVVAVVSHRPGVLAVQATTAANLSARVRKILAEPRARTWLGAGNEILVHGWAKRGPRGGRKVWTVRRVEVFLGVGGRVDSTEGPGL